MRNIIRIFEIIFLATWKTSNEKFLTFIDEELNKVLSDSSLWCEIICLWQVIEQAYE